MVLICSIVLAGQVPTRVRPLPALKSIVREIKCLVGEKPLEIGKRGIWYSPGYYELGAIWRFPAAKSEVIRKKLPLEGFKGIKMRTGPPITFIRISGDVRQQISVAYGVGMKLEFLDVEITETPVLPQGLKVWPKILTAPKPPVPEAMLYPFPGLRSFTVQTVTTSSYNNARSVLVTMSSKDPYDKVIKGMDKELAGQWMKSVTDKLTRYIVKGRSRTGPFQVEFKPGKGVTYALVTSRIEGSAK